ncbi:MAG: HAMP domain-containing sensor histidine kinase [Candidatus Poribacteria bacterium]
MSATVYLATPPEMERLLRKYGGGISPPLFNTQEDEGLLGSKGEEILNIYLTGFSKKYNIPLHLIPISETNNDQMKNPIEDGILSYENVRDLLLSCENIRLFNGREDNLNEDTCKNCIEKHILAIKNRKTMAYMCWTGMICLAVPVYVSGRISAILSTKCRKPKEGVIWPSNLIKRNYCLLPINENNIDENSREWQGRSELVSEKIDMWKESKRRIRECEEILELKPDELLNAIIDKSKNNELGEVTPDELQLQNGIINLLEKASEYLSELLNQNYCWEKESVIGWIRAEMGSALSSIDGFWDKIHWCLENLIRLIGMDYVLLLSYDRAANPHLQLLCNHGLHEESIPAMQYDYATNQLDEFIDSIKANEQIQEINLQKYRDIPILSILYSIYGKGTDYPVLTVSSNRYNGRLIFMILGKRNLLSRRRIADIDSENLIAPAFMQLGNWLRDDDRQHLMTIIREIGIIVHVFFSIKKMQETKEEQTNLMESILHDLKTPINNIMLAADNLRNARLSPEGASRTIAGVVTQLERLNLFAQKAWMVEQIRQNELSYNDEGGINIYNILSGCRDLMSDLAREKSIEIRIDPEIEKWQEARIDAEIFALVAMNLIQNGIKYSFPDTHIDVGGWRDTINSGIVLNFTNEGITISDAEKDRIFERHYRSKEAIRTDPTGSGVGLVLVKEFVEHYKGRIDVRSTEIRFGRYLNIFSIYLPGR